MNERDQAFKSYLFESRWSLFEIEVLSHHFCSSEPFTRSYAPGYPPVVDKLRSFGLIERGSHQVTTKGVQFIVKLCDTPVPGDEGEGSGQNLADANPKDPLP